MWTTFAHTNLPESSSKGKLFTSQGSSVLFPASSWFSAASALMAGAARKLDAVHRGRRDEKRVELRVHALAFGEAQTLARICSPSCGARRSLPASAR
jgi:hypothetical protein